MTEQSIRILLVEDNYGDVRLIEEMLKELKPTVEIEHAPQLSALRFAASKKYDLVILDLNLPDSEGLNTILKTQEMMPNIPIVVMTGLDNEELSFAAIQSGAQDYLVKGKTTAAQLAKTIKYALHRNRAYSNINEYGDNRKAYLATHDVLTGLPNQQFFLENLHLAVLKHLKTKKLFGLLLLEVHEIENIISFFGHFAKDELLKNLSTNLTTLFAESAFVSLYNESIFAILLPDVPEAEKILQYVGMIQQSFAKSSLIQETEYFLSYNMGAAVFPFDGYEAETLIKNTREALTTARQSGMGGYEIYKKERLDIAPHHEELIWHNDLQLALDRHEFFLVYQPQVDVITQKIIGVEALLRWKHPKHGLIPPSHFIAVAEDSHLINHIGSWVLESTAQQYHAWRVHHKVEEQLKIAINISVQQLKNYNLFGHIQKILKKYNLRPECLELEITESICIGDPESVIEKLNILKKLGVCITLDDFGSGYSSLSYLSHLPIDRIKIDKSFVQENCADVKTQSILESIIALAHSLNLKVIAEGVETEEQFEFLKQHKCDVIQGFYFSKPINPNEISHILENNFVIQQITA